MAEKFILVSLDDEKSKELADVISNKTARKILDYLSEKEGSSSEIGKDLGIALSTVEYNLKNLVKAGLVEVEEFKWSPKGRAMDIYKVKKKYIVIAPEKSSELREILRKVLPVGLVGLVVGGFIEFFSGSKIIKVPFTKEIVTKTITEGRQVGDKAVQASAEVARESAASAPAALADGASEPIINVTTQVTEVVKDVVLPNPHYGLWFILGLVVALGLYILFSLRKK